MRYETFSTSALLKIAERSPEGSKERKAIEAELRSRAFHSHDTGTLSIFSAAELEATNREKRNAENAV